MSPEETSSHQRTGSAPDDMPIGQSFLWTRPSRDAADPLIQCSVTSLHLLWACESLLDAGASVNATDASGRSALALATRFGEEDLAALLLKRGASGGDPYRSEAAELRAAEAEGRLGTGLPLLDEATKVDDGGGSTQVVSITEHQGVSLPVGNEAFENVSEMNIVPDVAPLEEDTETFSVKDGTTYALGTDIEYVQKSGNCCAETSTRGSSSNGEKNSVFSHSVDKSSSGLTREQNTQFLCPTSDDSDDLPKNNAEAANGNDVDNSVYVLNALLLALAGGSWKNVKDLIQQRFSRELEHDWTGIAFLLAACKGREDIVALLLKSGVSVNTQDANGFTALHLAAAGCHLRVVKLLLKTGARICAFDTEDRTPLSVAMEEGHTKVISLLKKYGEYSYEDLPEMEGLHKCFDENLVQKVTTAIQHVLYLEDRVRKRTSDRTSEPEKVRWTKKWMKRRVKRQHQTSVERSTRSGKKQSGHFAGTVFEKSNVMRWWEKVTSSTVRREEKRVAKKSITVRKLGEEEINMNWKRAFRSVYKYDQTFVHVAAFKGLAKSLVALVRDCSDVNIADTTGQTPLHKAAWKGDVECVDILLRYGAIVSIRDVTYKSSALHLAAMNGHPNCVVALIKGGTDVDIRDSRGKTPLHLCAWRGHESCVSTLVKHGADIFSRDESGVTALHIAALNGHVEVMNVLLEEGADVEMQDRRGQTPLHVSAWWGQAKCVSFLIENGSDVYSRDSYWRTPLHLAAGNDKTESVRALINGGADADYQDNDRRTALHISVGRGYMPCVSALVDGGADIEIRDSHGMTALLFAAFKGHRECVSLLLQKGADISSRGKKEMTALHLAARSGHVECASFLLHNGANILLRDRYRSTPLHAAAFHGHLACISVLIECGVRVNWEDSRGQTALHKAAQNGHAECIRALLDAGATVSSIDCRHDSALHLAAAGGHEEAVNVLLEAGASRTARNKYMKTPIDMTRLRSIRYLLS